MRLKDLEEDIKLLERTVLAARNLEEEVSLISRHVDHIKEDMIEELHHFSHAEDRNSKL